MKKKITFLVIVMIMMITKLSAQVSWNQQSTVFPSGYTSVSGLSLIDDSNVWAYSDNTISNKIGFSKTTDGINWNSSGEFIYGNNYFVTSFYAVSSSSAYLLLASNIDFTGILYKTINSGTTWSVVTTTENFPDFVHFFDANNGVIVCDSGSSSFFIYKTSNGGLNWNLINPTNLPSFIPNEYFLNTSFSYFQNSLWFTTNQGRFIKTDNQGAFWTAAQSPYTAAYSNTATNLNANFSLLNATTAYVLNGTGQVSKTINAGLNWTNYGVTNNSGTLYICSIPNTNVILSSGSTTFSKYSIDNGQNWTIIDNDGKKDLKSTSINAVWSIGNGAQLFKLNSANLKTFEISNRALKEKFLLYPNPATNSFLVKSIENLTESFDYKIVDFQAKVLKSGVSKFDEQINIESLSSGNYIIQIENKNDGKVIEKLIKN